MSGKMNPGSCVIASLLIAATLCGFVRGATIYVNGQATGANDGSTWIDAFTNLQDALAVASSGDRILVAQGTYKPVPRGGSRSDAFPLRQGVSLEGGYAGYDDVRDVQAYLTILSGDLNDDDAPQFKNNADNSRRVVFISGDEIDPNTVLDGFTISGGNGSYGSGIYCRDASPTIINCTIRDNQSERAGAGMYNTGDPILINCSFIGNRGTHYRRCDDEGCRNEGAHGGGLYNVQGKPVLKGCSFIQNSAEDHGGGIYNAELAELTLTDCILSENTTSENGGGIYNYERAELTLTGCILSGNRASQSGGGVYNRSGSEAMFYDCNFSENTASNDGGGIVNIDCNAIITNCTFTSNRTLGDDGGAIASFSCMPVLIGCTFTGNYSDEDGGAFAVFDGGAALQNCLFRDNAVEEDGGAMYVWNSQVTLQSCTFADNFSGDDGAAMCNRAGSLAFLTECTFTANHARDNGGAVFNRDNIQFALWNCSFIGNIARSTGGAIYSRADSMSQIQNCLFAENVAHDSGGAMSNRNGSIGLLSHCTLSGNSATFDGGGIFNWDGCQTLMGDCILWGNSDDSGNTQAAQMTGGALEANHSCVQGLTGELTGTGNIGSDPLFVSGLLGDYYLSQIAAGQTQESPCVDAGGRLASVSRLDRLTTRTDNVPDSSTADIGLHYARPKSWDINSDGQTNLLDFAALALVWQDKDCGHCGGSDITLDGDVAADDLEILFKEWLGP